MTRSLSFFVLFLSCIATAASAAAQRRVATPVSRARIQQIAAREDVHRGEIERHVDTIQARNAVDGRIGRGFHHAGIASMEVGYTPALHTDPAIREALAGGALERRSTGVLRFSHGRPEGDPSGGRRDQRSPDVRGAGLTLGAQALTFTNQRSQIVQSGVQFLRIFNELGAPKTKLTLPVRLARAVGTGTLLRGLPKLALGALPIPNLLTAQYWGPPIVVGESADGGVYIARPTLIPLGERAGTGIFSRLWQGVRSSRLLNRNPEYLTQRAADGLASGFRGFDLGLQFYIDDVATPLVNDGNVAWTSPVIPAGHIYPTSRTLLSAERTAEVEARGNFGPQVVDQSVRAPAVGVGTFQAHRDIAYRRSASNRLNQQ